MDRSNKEKPVMNEAIQTMSFSCPLPIKKYKQILLAHGGGGHLTHDLIENLFYPKFKNLHLNKNHDGAIVKIPGDRLAFTTDSYVVSPIFFPGGDIGSLAVYGTVNDLAMCGARPLYISLGFILEEGLPMEDLWRIVTSIEKAAKITQVEIVTGDTKVVDRGKGDGLFINTTGIGQVIAPHEVSPEAIKPGDAVIISGPIGNHGIAIMALREGLEFDSPIYSDSAPVSQAVLALFEHDIEVHCLRDPTRGGLASSLNEIAHKSGLGIEIDEGSVPISEQVQGACEILGLDPFYVASEGRFLAFVANGIQEKALEVLHKFENCQEAKVIGHVTESHPEMVVLHSKIGGNRVLDWLSGEQLPRIC